MAATLNQLVELILKRKYGGQLTPDQFITEQQVELHVLQVADKLIRYDLFEKMKLTGDKEIDPAYLLTYDDIVIQWDDRRDTCFLMLPVKPASLINDLGIFSIRPLKGQTTANRTEFRRIPNGMYSLLPEGFEGYIGWIYQDSTNRIDLMYAERAIWEGKEVMAQLVPSSVSQLDGDAALPIPSHLEDAIVRDVLTLLGGPGEFDSVNDK